MTIRNKSFSDLITFTRASSATYFDSAGVLRTATSNVPRFDYNPITLAIRGLLVEEQRINSIRNNTMVGAVAGTPGASPTNWGITSTNAELVLSVIGTGTESGITYIDVRITGTMTASRSLDISMEVTNNIAASSGQTWTQSVYLRQVGGSQTNISAIYVQANTYTAANAYITTPWLAAQTVTTAALATQRLSAGATLSGATTAFIAPFLKVTTAASGAVDFTLRIGMPQLEQGAFATSVISTTAAAATRSADVVSINTLSPWYNASAGTLYAEVQVPYDVPSVQYPNILNITDGTSNNRMIIFVYSNSGNRSHFSGNVSGFQQWGLDSSGTVSAKNTTTKLAAAYQINNIAFSVNGISPLTDLIANIPTVTRLELGVSAGQYLNGYIRRIVYYPNRLTNAELQAITT